MFQVRWLTWAGLIRDDGGKCHFQGLCTVHVRLQRRPPRVPNSSVVTRERSAHPVCSVIVSVCSVIVSVCSVIVSVCSVIVWRLHPSEKKGAILTQWRARARSATLGCRVCSLSTGRTIHILTRHPCVCEKNCATRSRATPRYATLHSRRGAMRKMGLFRPSGTRARVAPRYVVGRGHKVEGMCCRYQCAIPATASESRFENPVLQCVQHRYARPRTRSVLVIWRI